MMSIDDLKKARCEWHEDTSGFVMMDSAGCIHRVSRVWIDGIYSWSVAWMFAESPYGLPHVSGALFSTPEAAKEWVDTTFSEHFEWFEAV